MFEYTYTKENAEELVEIVKEKFRKDSILVQLINEKNYEYVLYNGAKSLVIVYSDPYASGAAIGYARVSSDGQGDNGFGLDCQHADIIRCVEKYNSSLEDLSHRNPDNAYFKIELAVMCFDIGISANQQDDLIKLCDKPIATKDYFDGLRPALHFALSHLNCTNRIVTRDVDRLWREFTFTGCAIQQIIMSVGSDIISYTNMDYTLWETNPTQFMCNSIKNSLAEVDRRTTTKKLWEAQVKAMETGRDLSRGRPYGYDRQEDNHLVINPKEAEVIKTIIIPMVENENSANAIAKYLNQQGIPSKNNKLWKTDDVYAVFRNSRRIFGFQDYGNLHYARDEWKIVEPTETLISRNIVWSNLIAEEVNHTEKTNRRQGVLAAPA